MAPYTLLVLIALVPVIAGAEGFVFSSENRRVQLLELFTSQGCSSCPPADAWLSRLKEDPRLWQGVVPVAFHVDYWDRLGWEDPFAAPGNDQRQYRYAALWKNRSGVYTPGFVVDGAEWRGYFRRQDLPQPAEGPVGSLVLEVAADGAVRGRFGPASSSGPLQLHVALLGCGLSTAVKAGENRGRSLQHDFVVLEQVQGLNAGKDGHFQWAVSLPKRVSAPRLAVAAWVTKEQGLIPLQAVGGWLEAKGQGE